MWNMQGLYVYMKRRGQIIKISVAVIFNDKSSDCNGKSSNLFQIQAIIITLNTAQQFEMDKKIQSNNAFDVHLIC